MMRRTIARVIGMPAVALLFLAMCVLGGRERAVAKFRALKTAGQKFNKEYVH